MDELVAIQRTLIIYFLVITLFEEKAHVLILLSDRTIINRSLVAKRWRKVNSEAVHSRIMIAPNLSPSSDIYSPARLHVVFLLPFAGWRDSTRPVE